MEYVKDLPNIGVILAGKLESAGIITYEDLCEVGSIAAFKKITLQPGDGCANMLYALEGAIRKIRWHDIPKDERARLWNDYSIQSQL